MARGGLWEWNRERVVLDSRLFAETRHIDYSW